MKMYVINGTERRSALTILLKENEEPFLIAEAIPKEPPRQMNALPTSNKLVETTPIGPRKPCIKGSAKTPMLYPGRFRTSKARCSLLL